MTTVQHINIIATLDFLLFKAYQSEWQVIDGLNQHPNGLNYFEWLKKHNLIDQDEFNRIKALLNNFEEE